MSRQHSAVPPPSAFYSDLINALCLENLSFCRSNTIYFDEKRSFSEEKIFESNFETSLSYVQGQPCSPKANFEQKTPSAETHFAGLPSPAGATIRDAARYTPKSLKCRRLPLPLLPWANSKELWQAMVDKEEATSCRRTSRLFEDSKLNLPRMRYLLLDWIMEVSAAFSLTRVTYYLAVDYIDRYFTLDPTIPKPQIQLLGVSCLFIAAKLEEIYPPKIYDFAYICDEAYTVKDIEECEIIILNALNWDLNPTTPTGWLNLYMQIQVSGDAKPLDQLDLDASSAFIFPQYSSYQFVRASHIIDLFSFDPAFLRFNYSVIAAGAMCCLLGRVVALKVSGLSWSELEECSDYMQVFYKAIKDSSDEKFHTRLLDLEKSLPRLYLSANYKINMRTEVHALQTRVIGLKDFENATLCMLKKMGFSAEAVVDEEEDEESSSGRDKQKQLGAIFKVAKLSSAVECNLGNSPSQYFTSKSIFSFDDIIFGINTNQILNKM